MKKLILFIILALTTNCSFSQEVLNDVTFRNQFIVTELGSTVPLTPDLYYDTFHRDYRMWAITSAKTVHRGNYNMWLTPQPGYSEFTDSMLNQRAESELINVGDRQKVFDFAWQLGEGKKIDEILSKLRRQIERISLSGGTTNVQDRYMEKYNCLITGIDVIRNAYLSNSERKKQYLEIFNDAERQLADVNMLLCHYALLRNQISRGTISARKKESNLSIAMSAHTRWSGVLRNVSRQLVKK